MKIGDLVRNRSTGQLSVITGVGKAELTTWLTLYDGSNGQTVYHAEYFVVVSPTKEQEDAN